MATTLIGWRPSALPAVCVSVPSGAPARIPGHVPGIPAGAIPTLTGPTYVPPVRTLNNSIGTPVAVVTAAEGAAMSGRVELSQQLGADKVKGFDARGNPPRGRRRV